MFAATCAQFTLNQVDLNDHFHFANSGFIAITHMNSVMQALFTMDDAAFEQHLILLKENLQNEVNQLCDLDWTPLMVASFFQLLGKCKILIRYGADVHYQMGQLPWNCIYTCVRYFTEDQKAEIDFTTLNYLLDETEIIVLSNSLIQFIESAPEEKNDKTFTTMVAKCPNLMEEDDIFDGIYDGTANPLQAAMYFGKSEFFAIILQRVAMEERQVVLQNVFNFVVGLGKSVVNSSWLKQRKPIMDLIVQETKMDEDDKQHVKINLKCILLYLLNFAVDKKRKYEERLRENYMVRVVLGQSSSNAIVSKVLTFLGGTSSINSKSNKRQKS